MAENRWTTEDEKGYIDVLGGHVLSSGSNGKERASNMGMSRLKLLINYAKSMKNRTDWGEVDRSEIEKYVRQKLRSGVQDIRAKSV